MSVKVFKQEVKLSFDNGITCFGSISAKTFNCEEDIIELTTIVCDVGSFSDKIQSVTVDKKDFIKFLKSGLELLEGEG